MTYSTQNAILRMQCSLIAPVACRTTTHSTALSFVFFIKAACVVIKMQHSGPQLHSVVNLQDCFTAQRRRASQQRTGRSAHVVLRVNLEAERQNTPEADSVFACVLVANDSSRLSERRLNQERKQSSHFENELCAWYHTCDQLEEPSCCFCHPSEAAPYVWMSFSRWITALLICSHHPSCCLIHWHPFLVLVFFHYCV